MPEKLLRALAPYARRFLGIREPQPQLRPDEYYKDPTVLFETGSRSQEAIQDPNTGRVFNREIFQGANSRPDTLITVRGFQNGTGRDERYGSPHSPSHKYEKMDPQTWDEINNRFDASKRNHILGYDNGGSVAKFQNSGIVPGVSGNGRPGSYRRYTYELDGDKYREESYRPYRDNIEYNRIIKQTPDYNDTTIVVHQPGTRPSIYSTPGAGQPREGWNQQNEMFDRFNPPLYPTGDYIKRRSNH